MCSPFSLLANVRLWCSIWNSKHISITYGHVFKVVTRDKEFFIFHKFFSPSWKVKYKQSGRVSQWELHCPWIFLKRLRNITFLKRESKTRKIFNQNILCPGRDFNRAPPEYEPITLLLRQLVWWIKLMIINLVVIPNLLNLLLPLASPTF